MFHISPRLFISYARKDVDFARSIHAALTRTGYKVFLDESSIYVGDIFPDRIVAEIKRADGCILLITDSSSKSEWCKLEAYYAHFLNKMFIPIRIGNGDFGPENPLKAIQKNVQYITVTDSTESATVVDLIKSKLLVVKRNAYNRIVRKAGLPLLISTFVALFLTFGIKGVNRLVYINDKKLLLESISNSKKIYNRDEINVIKEQFKNDKELVAQLHLQEKDPEFSDIARVNSKIISATLLQSFSVARRQYIKNIQWINSAFNNGSFNSTTFTSGNLSGVDFYSSVFNDVYFAGSDSEQGGVALSGLTFSNCKFNAVSFDRNNAIGLKFKACTFNCSFINTTDFGGVRFFSIPEEDPAVITNSVMTSFINCIFQNDTGDDPEGTLVLGKEGEMQFDEVLFDACRFVGLVRPEWFKKCTFINCSFPSASVLSELESGNIMNNNRVN